MPYFDLQHVDRLLRARADDRVGNSTMRPALAAIGPIFRDRAVVHISPAVLHEARTVVHHRGPSSRWPSYRGSTLLLIARVDEPLGALRLAG
jgi:hypothetical protein